MLHALKRLLGVRPVNHPTPSLFSGSAYFSNRVCKDFTEKWVAHGGEISLGTTLDVRARYFFATDPSDPWVTKLLAKSVVVIHAGWIVDCIDQAFQVPVSEYILDDRFTPGPPYKLHTISSGIYVPLSEPDDPIENETGVYAMLVPTSDTPSTPPSLPRKRKLEQVYFDSPSGSLVFSGFDKDGLPRRPKKQRKLRFDPSFSPEGGISGREVTGTMDPERRRDHHIPLCGNDVFSEEHGQRGAGLLCDPSHVATVRAPDTPDQPLTGTPDAPYRRFSMFDHLVEPRELSPIPSCDIPEEIKVVPVRAIDFTNLPPPNRRFRFPEANTAKSGGTDTILSFTKSTDNKVKTPKKISFADRARVRVYTISPRQPDAKDSTDADPPRPRFDDDVEDEREINVETRVSYDSVEGCADTPVTTETRLGLNPPPCSPKMDVDLTQPGVGQFEGDTLTMEDVEELRGRLLESAAMNGIDNGQLAALFELGKAFRGMEFRHVW